MPEYCVAPCVPFPLLENLPATPPVGREHLAFPVPPHPTSEPKGSEFTRAILGKFGKFTLNLTPSPHPYPLFSLPQPTSVPGCSLASHAPVSTISCHILGDLPPAQLRPASLDRNQVDSKEILRRIKRTRSLAPCGKKPGQRRGPPYSASKHGFLFSDRLLPIYSPCLCASVR